MLTQSRDNFEKLINKGIHFKSGTQNQKNIEKIASRTQFIDQKLINDLNLKITTLEHENRNLKD
jgi:hypothetical protein